MKRRDFLKISGSASAGLLIGFVLPARRSAAAAAALEPNAYVRIGTDGTVTLTIDKSEMGQGVLTSMRQILADEIEADWESIRLGPVPDNPAAWDHNMITAGSGSIRGSYERLRHAGAAARELLRAAAAQRWEVSIDDTRAENGFVIHGDKRLSYGDLAAEAAGIPLPKMPPLKNPKDFRYIGKAVRRLDSPEKVDGTAVFGIDVDVPGMLAATIIHAPVLGGTVRSVNAEAVQQMPGIRRVVELRAHPRFEDGKESMSATDSAVAIVAERYWQALAARAALDIVWDDGPNAGLSSQGISAQLRGLAEQEEAIRARDEGDVSGAAPSKTIDAEYETPYLHQAPMEPLNCTAHVQGNRCEIWAGTQAQSAAQTAVARVLGIPLENVRIHTTLLGGGFGRRAETDFIAEAALISKEAGAPVKLIWTREEDMQHGFFRPATYHRLAGGVDAEGNPVLWKHRIVAPSLLIQDFGRPDVWEKPGSGIDTTSVEGARDLPYNIPNLRVELIHADVPVPLGWWRSVGSSQNAFVTEGFIDEMAEAAGEDPFEFRRRLLAAHPRHRRVLEIAAEKAGWGRPLPEGRGRGIAVAESFGSIVAEVAEVSIENGRPRVHRVVCAVDCGQIVNPDTVEAQMEGGIVFGITAALYGEITIEGGRVAQSNFHDYALLRMNEMPEVEVHLAPSGDAHGGVGEPGVPPAAPAVCNALYTLTGRRVRKLPITLTA